MSLPEKKYFSIDEIAKRWNCGIDFIFQYLEMRILSPSIIYKGLEGELWKGDIPGNEISSTLLSEEYKLHNTIVYIWDYNNLNRTLFDDQPVIELTGSVLVFDIQNPDKWIRVKPKSVGGFLLDDDNFIISKNERDRFEKEHNINIDNIHIKIKSLLTLILLIKNDYMN